MQELTTESLWLEDVRECFLNGAKIIKSDSIYSDTLSRLVMDIDSDLASKGNCFTTIKERLSQIVKVLESPNYQANNMKNFTEKEREISEDIYSKTLTLIQIASIEEKQYTEKEVSSIKDRLPNGNEEVEKIYEVAQNKRERVL